MQAKQFNSVRKLPDRAHLLFFHVQFSYSQVISCQGQSVSLFILFIFYFTILYFVFNVKICTTNRARLSCESCVLVGNYPTVLNDMRSYQMSLMAVVIHNQRH